MTITWSGHSSHWLCHLLERKGHCGAARALPSPLSTAACPSPPTFDVAQMPHPLAGSLSCFNNSDILFFLCPSIDLTSTLIRPLFPGQAMVIGVCVLPLCALQCPGPKATPGTGCYGFLDPPRTAKNPTPLSRVV